MSKRSARVSGLAIGILALTSAISLAQRPAPIVAPGGTDADKTRLAELRAVALGEDRLAAKKALEEMKSMAAVGKPTLVDSLRAILIRDKTVLENAARKAALPGNDLAKIEAEAEVQRKASRGHIEELSKKADTRAARAAYQKLRAAITRLTDAYDTRSTLLDAMRYRAAFVAMWTEVDPKVGPKVTDPASETALAAMVEKALGDKLLPLLRQMQSQLDDVNDPAATLPEQNGLLEWRMRKRVDAYNRSLAAIADPAELELIRMINAYRDALGLPALELDPRLLQAARRHSKEMVEQKYFSPTSPNEATKDALSRMKAAGLENPGPWSEALARNTKTATETFWGMFDTPPYHQAMASADLTSVGIGRWNAYWTINLVAGERLMLATPERRAEAHVAGDMIDPQTPLARSDDRGGAGGNDGRNTDPTKIRPMIPGGAGSVPSIPSLPGF